MNDLHLRTSAPVRFQVWHLLCLVAFVAFAIADMQDQRIHEPALIAIASAGFVAYGILGIVGWRWLNHVRAIPDPLRLPLYASAMSGLFLVATVVYLVIEYRYRN